MPVSWSYQTPSLGFGMVINPKDAKENNDELQAFPSLPVALTVVNQGQPSCNLDVDIFSWLPAIAGTGSTVISVQGTMTDHSPHLLGWSNLVGYNIITTALGETRKGLANL